MVYSNIFVCLTCAFINILLTILYYKKESRKDTLAITFYVMNSETVFLAVVEIIWALLYISQNEHLFLLKLCATLVYLIVSFLAFDWMLYIIFYFSAKPRKFKFFFYFMTILIIAETVLLILNFFDSSVFYFDENNRFIETTYTYFIVLPQLISYSFVFFYSIYKTVQEKNKMIRSRHIGIVFFSLIPIVYEALQMIFVEPPLDVMGFTFAGIIVYAFNITKNSDKELVLQKTLQQETTSKCIQVLYEYNTTEVAIDKILSFIASYHNAEHAYVFEFNTNKNLMSLTYEWCKKGVDLQIKNLKNVDINIIEEWIDEFNYKDSVIISLDEKVKKESNYLYTYLNLNFIHSLIAVPLRENGKIVGFIGVSNPNSYTDDITLLRSVSSVAYSEILRRQLSERNNEIIQILASEYTSVCYANLDEDLLIPYSMNKESEAKYGQAFGKGIEIERAFRMYIDNDVYEPDKSFLRQMANIHYIKKELANRKSTEVLYRKNNNGSPVYTQVKFVKIDDVDEMPTAVAIGFSDKNEEVIGKFVTKQLLNSYASIYFIDLQNNTIRAYKESTTMEVGRFSKVLPYDKVVNSFADEVAEADQDKLRRLANPVYAQDFLADEDSREMLYEVPGLDRPKRRAIWNVVERKNGLPITVIASFMGVDKITSEKMELDEKLAEQKKKLEDQAVLLEDALSQAQIANKAKTTFLTNMSHDIRTPMNAIIGFTELALQNIDDKERIKEYLLKSSVSSQHLLSLINDILDMNRIESGKFMLNEEINNIPAMIKDVKSIIHGMADTKKQKLIMDKVELIDENIYCDKLRVNQIIINLLSNAIKFTPECGEIHTSIIQKTSKEDYGEYEIKVRDNGVGMSPEFLDKIFTPFEREKTSTISKTQGTGLGMAITKSIIDMLGGTIEVKSKLGKGSEFTVTVPFRTTDEVYKDEEDVFKIDEEQFKGKRVLVVEDNEMNREIIEEILQESGFETEAAEDGKYAVDMVRGSIPGYYDLILMDIQMPIMDGYTATKVIRKLADKDLANIPIVAMTANAFEEDRKEAFACGMNEHVTKPISIENLFKVLAQIL